MTNFKYFFDEMGKVIDHYSNHYENFITFGDFNIEEKQEEIKMFMELYQLKNLIKEPTCLKSDYPKCIDLILTNISKFRHDRNRIIALSFYDSNNIKGWL